MVARSEVNRTQPAPTSREYQKGKVKTLMFLEPAAYNWTKAQSAIRKITMSEVIGMSIKTSMNDEDYITITVSRAVEVASLTIWTTDLAVAISPKDRMRVREIMRDAVRDALLAERKSKHGTDL